MARSRMKRLTKRQVAALLKPGTKLTLVFRDAKGGTVRKYRTVLGIVGDRVYTRVDHNARNRERVTRIILSGDSDRPFYLLSWGFLIVAGTGMRSVYVWGHHGPPAD
jgi:hypothetical protein